MKTPFLLCQYPCGLFIFTSSASLHQDVKDRAASIILQYFHHTRLQKKTLQKQGRQASCGIYIDNVDIRYNHRNCNYSYFKLLYAWIPLLATDKQSFIYSWLLIRIFTTTSRAPLVSIDYIRSPANYSLHVLGVSNTMRLPVDDSVKTVLPYITTTC